MPISCRLLYTLVEIWARKDEPETADLRRVAHAAEILDGDPSSPTHLRAFAWRLLVETHRAVGWDLPSGARIASCRAAADSLGHAASLVLTDVTARIRGVAEPALILGGVADSRSVFGRWDLLPDNNAVLMALDRGDAGRANFSAPAAGGVRWASPGDLRSLYAEHATPVTLNGHRVLVPRPALIAARSADRSLRPEDPSALTFCGAALAAAVSGQWSETLRIARRLGGGSAPLAAALQLRIENALGLEVSLPQRLRLTLRRLSRR